MSSSSKVEKFYMHGESTATSPSNTAVESHIFGNITGNLKVARGSKVIHSGTLVGDATNEGGRLYVDATAKIHGKIKTLKGETKIEPVPTVPGARRRDERNGKPPPTFPLLSPLPVRRQRIRVRVSCPMAVHFHESPDLLWVAPG